MVFREHWLAINGTDETFTNTVHYEDMDFCLRARNAGLQCSRKAHQLYRLHHWYGAHSGRANIRPETEFKPNCPACEAACAVLEPNRFDLQARLNRGEIDVFDSQGLWVCKTCHLCGPVYHRDYGEHTGHVERTGRTRAVILPQYKIGRNLRILAADMDGKSLSEKVDIYNRSWTAPKYYTEVN